VALLALALALAATPAWGASGGATPGPKKLNAARLGPLRTGTGIVQAVRRNAVLVRQLDGRALRVPVGPSTVVFVNGVLSRLGDLRPGFVVTFTVRAGRPATVIRASDPAASGTTAVKPGTVQCGTVTVAIDARTRVWLNESPVTIGEIAAGDQLVKVAGDASGRKPARVLRFRRPG
jgi:hypothetical protein